MINGCIDETAHEGVSTYQEKGFCHKCMSRPFVPIQA